MKKLSYVDYPFLKPLFLNFFGRTFKDVPIFFFFYSGIKSNTFSGLFESLKKNTCSYNIIINYRL